MMTLRVVTFNYDNKSMIVGEKIGFREVCRGIALGDPGRKTGILANSFSGLHHHSGNVADTLTPHPVPHRVGLL